LYCAAAVAATSAAIVNFDNILNFSIDIDLINKSE